MDPNLIHQSSFEYPVFRSSQKAPLLRASGMKYLNLWLTGYFLSGGDFDVTDGERRAHVFLPRLKRMELDSDAIQSVYGLALSPSSTRPEAFEGVGYGRSLRDSERTIAPSPISNDLA
jgi:hypothetical protein